jgi:hypothetical protein
MDMGGANWSIITIVGPLLLAAVLLWAFLRNRKDRADTHGPDDATRRVYDEEEAARREEDGDG